MEAVPERAVVLQPRHHPNDDRAEQLEGEIGVLVPEVRRQSQREVARPGPRPDVGSPADAQPAEVRIRAEYYEALCAVD